MTPRVEDGMRSGVPQDEPRDGTPGLPQASGAWRFSSDDFPEEGRLKQVRDQFGALLPFEIEPMHGARFRNVVTMMALPDLGVASGVSQGAMFHRTKALARQSDDFTFCITQRGRSINAQRGVEVLMSGGDAFFGASDLLSTSGPLDGAVGCLSLRLPRDALASADIDLDAAFTRPIPRDVETLRLLRGYMGVVRHAATSGSVGAQRLVASHVHDLVALALGEASEFGEIARGRGLQAARLRAIKADVRANLRERELSAETVARRQGVSPSYVRKLFDLTGSSFSAFVLDQRVACAHAMLSNPRFAGLGVSAIAYDVGFGDLSYFNRVFRRRYGATPTEVRAGVA
jgi:AraC-like DNA-binding protein